MLLSKWYHASCIENILVFFLTVQLSIHYLFCIFFYVTVNPLKSYDIGFAHRTNFNESS